MLRNAFKIYNNLRIFSRKNTLLNIARNNSILNAIKNKENIKDTISPETKTYAKIANQSYNKDRLKNIDGFQLLKEVSDDELAVYKKGNLKIFVHRGTANKEDVGTDTFILNNNLKESDRYKNSILKVQNIINDDKDMNYLHVGHSLGGSISKLIGKELNHKSIGFNAGNSSIHINNPLHTDHIILGDPISNSQLLQTKNNVNIYRKRVNNPHTLENFL